METEERIKTINIQNFLLSKRYDNDGLPDALEVMKDNPNNSDSDGDGYLDAIGHRSLILLDKQII